MEHFHNPDIRMHIGQTVVWSCHSSRNQIHLTPPHTIVLLTNLTLVLGYPQWTNPASCLKTWFLSRKGGI